MPSVDDASRADVRMPRLAQAHGFLREIKDGWARSVRRPAVVSGAATAAARHRALLSARFRDDVLVVAAGRAPVRNNDCFHLFRPESDFYWLTGSSIEGAVLVMSPSLTGHDSILFIDPPARPGEDGYFSDPIHGELWVGPRPSLTEWSDELDVTVAPMSELAATLDTTRSALLAGSVEPDGLPVGVQPSPALGQVLSELRMYKDEWELQQLRDSVDATVAGFEAVVAEIPKAVEGLGERWLQGTFDRHARAVGNGPGYSTIVGSGHHAPTLHWVDCDGPVVSGDLLLLDMGVEMRSLYTADVTRTFPVSGRYTPAQRSVHDLVERAHRAGLAAVKPGNRFGDFHSAVMEVIAAGLHDWGLLRVSVDEALAPHGQQHRRYLPCGVGHHLGLDVHDCASSSYDSYQGGILADGMVLTVEPGLYFHANDMTVPPEIRGLGVRIEDDVHVTAAGSTVLSDALPIDADGLERWMLASSGPGPRAVAGADSDTVG